VSKRYLAPRPKEGELKMKWAKLPDAEEPDVCIAWGDGCNRADSSLLFNALCSERNRYMNRRQDPSVIDELMSRGYDISTLRFYISKSTDELNSNREGE